MWGLVCLGSPYLLASEGRIQKAKLNYKAVAKALHQFMGGSSGLDSPSELDPLLPPTPAAGGPDLYSLMPTKGSRLFQRSNQGSWEAGEDKFTQS